MTLFSPTSLLPPNLETVGTLPCEMHKS